MSRASSKSQPFLSIVIPTFERPDPLRKCIESLMQCDYPHSRMEVIVVDDGGSAAIELPPAPSGLRLTLVRQQNRGPAEARNLGASHATGELLVFTDDDCRADAGWLTRLAERHLDAADEMLGGLVINELRDNAYASTSQFLLDLVYEKCNRSPSQATFLTSNNMAIPAGAFRDLGGFDPRLRTAEDRDLCDRWLFSGRRISFLPDAVVYHAHQMGLLDFCRQHYAYGRGASMFHRLRRLRGSGTMRNSVAFHRDPRNWLLPSIQRGLPRGWSIAALTVFLQIANVAGFGREQLLGELPAPPAHPPPSKPTPALASEFVHCSFLSGKSLPLIAQPTKDARVEALIDWLRSEDEWVHDKILEHGALLLRGFSVREPSEFEAICRAIAPGVRSDFVGTPWNRLPGTEHVDPASERPTVYPISQHCELSYLPEPPRHVFFCCLKPPTDGKGETPLADNRKFWRMLDENVRERFSQRGIRVVRNMCGPKSRFRIWTQFRWDK